ncbi:NAD(P)-dependent alcohol dehydrogenase [Geodermatophilus ruber]|uniref:alcohol dehydrogenase n=1 Tax=Geodermatophilus ruber TaxID=504800 RepID=A0A1I3Z8R0_9ACTN|nr:NAD(P)-dependent alcohol dehydrogenase [Geodermatophilus ruber]SFK40457.1 alcohol dehydrogenase, propanol-preferring [Geodermatophilus ruber]
MRAYRYTGPHRAELTEIPVPEPGLGDVLVRVGASGACHSDLGILAAPPGAFPVPLTLGHEVAGYVESLGSGVSGWDIGEPVVVHALFGCGRCRACVLGLENRCRVVGFDGLGLTRDGGMADYVVVPETHLVRTGDLDLTQAAPLADAGLTAYHAIELCRDALRPGTHCVVIGVGGLGHMAVQILAATTGVSVIAVDVEDAALELAARLGAAHTVRSGPDAVEHIREIVGPFPDGADVVLDFVGVTPTLDTARAVVSRGGRLALVGLGQGELTFRPTPGNPVTEMPVETSAVVPFWGNHQELAEVVALARAGHVTAETQVFPLADVAEAYAKLERGEVRGRAVMVP